MSNKKSDKDNRLRFIKAMELSQNGSKSASPKVQEFKYLIEKD
jgi:hypothetical protein